QDVLAVLAAYRPRYARVADLAGYGAEFAATGELEVVERLDGIGMTDYYGVSGRPAGPEHDPMTDAECERKNRAAASILAYLRRLRGPGLGRAAQGPAGRRPRAGGDHRARERRGDLRVR